MCRICDGFSLEDVLAIDAATIAEEGFALIGVSRDGGFDPSGAWAYSVGLLDAVDHPEMIIAGVSPETSRAFLSMLARSALAGERYEVGDSIDIGGGIARVGRVHPVQYELDTFNMWHEQRLYGSVLADELEAVQIILPSTSCAVHRLMQPLLDDPDARVDAPRPRPNRAERRRRPRRHSG